MELGGCKMYRIAKILNNNGVLATKDGQEVIFLGKGIGFGKKVNDLYEPVCWNKRI